MNDKSAPWPPEKKLSEKHWVWLLPDSEVLKISGGVMRNTDGDFSVVELRVKENLSGGSGDDRKILVPSELAKGEGEFDSALIVAHNIKTSPLKEMTGAEWILMAAFEPTEENFKKASELAKSKEKKSYAPSFFLACIIAGIIAVIGWTACLRATGEQARKAGAACFVAATLGWSFFAAYVGTRPEGLPGAMDMAALLPIATACALMAFWSLDHISKKDQETRK